MSEPLVITFSPPLPCSALLALGRRCGAPATVAYLGPQSAGTFHLQPFCARCVAALAQTYLPPKGSADADRPD